MRSSERGFTLVEVLVALAIVAVALGAAVRAAGVIAGTDAGLRIRAMAVTAAENRLAELRLAREFPSPGRVEVDCSHGGYALRCEQVFRSSVNAGFREVEIRVREAGEGGALVARLGGLLSRLPRGRRGAMPGRLHGRIGRRRLSVGNGPARSSACDDAGLPVERPLPPSAGRRAPAAARQPPRRRPQHGFTLIELLVAITLMAVLSLIAWRGLEGIVHLRERLAGDADETESLLRMLGQLERDLALRAPDSVLVARVGPTVPQQVGDRRKGEFGDGSGGGSDVKATNLRPLQSLPLALGVQAQRDSARLEIVREAPGTPGAWQRVAWWQADGVLYRAVGAASAVYPLPPPESTTAVMDAVTGFAVRGYADQTGWLALPPPPGMTAPLSGVDVTITRGAPARPATYRRVVTFR